MKKNLFVFLVLIFLSTLIVTALPASAEEVKMNHNIKSGLVTMVDATTDLSVTLNPKTTENYYPSSRQWNGIPSVITCGNNIFVAWYTGGPKEPSTDNYVVVAASDDGGATWIDPFIIIDPLDTSMRTVVPMFFYNADGDLWLAYRNWEVGYEGIRLLNADGDLALITHSAPQRLNGHHSSFTKPTLLKDGRLVYASGGADTAVFESKDGGNSFQLLANLSSAATGSGKKVYSEACIVELSDGTLWVTSRLESGYNGGIEQGFSTDGGKTWSVLEANLPEPLRGPGSRFAMRKLQSGAIILINHNSTTRNNMTAYLSYDDGHTWPYSLLLDKYETSYPDVYQSEDGKIYVVFDKGRYTEAGIRLCILTEDDIKAGKMYTEESRDKLVVAKANEEYADIISVNDAYELEYVKKVGTPSSEIRDRLPTEFAVTDSNGTEHTLSGTWKSPGYTEEKAGTYEIVFQTDLPAALLDSYNMLTIHVTLSEDDPSSGCSGSVFVGGGLLAVSVISGAAVLLKKRKRELKKI